jgi:hypothetical protein
MEKIHSDKDLSKEILAIDIESPVFNGMLFDLDSEIKRCLQQVYDEDFEGGEITLKLSIELPEASLIIPKAGEKGEMLSDTYYYRKPFFEHKVATVLKKQFKKDGCFTGEREVQFKDGKFIAVPVDKIQIEMDI